MASQHKKKIPAPQTYPKRLQPSIKAAISIYNHTHWFTDREAWGIFRIAAFGEVIGWTMLISAIVYRSADLPHGQLAVAFAGRIHGILFILYFVSALITARSMKWDFKQIILALLAGTPPYASFVFEQIMARQRKNHPVYVEPPANIYD